MPPIAGLNIAVGLNLRNFSDGLRSANVNLDNFLKKMKTIKLAGLITGDPFSATTAYINNAKKSVGEVFRAWKKNINTVRNSYGKWAETSKKTTDSLIRDFNKLQKKMGTIGELSSLPGQFRSFEEAKKGIKSGRGGFIPIQELIPSAFQKDFKRQLRDFVKLGGEGTEAVQTFLNKFTRNIKVNRKTADVEMKKLFDGIETIYNTKGKSILKQYEQFGQRINRAFRIQEFTQYKEQLKQAGSVEAALKRRSKAIRELTINERRLRVEISKGIDVNKNREALMNSLKRREELGVQLTRRHRIELQKLRREYDRKMNADAFFGPNWFKQRARWFLQLRGFWAIYRGIGITIRDLAEFHMQLSRAMRTANSAIRSTTVIAKEYTDAMLRAATVHAATWQQSAEVLYQLTSAGLSSEEALAGLNSTLQTVIGLEGDARETTKAIAGVYNNFKDTLKDVGTEQKQFQYINDLVAATWRRHQIEINELTDAYRQSSAMARVAGLSLKDLTTIIAVANDHMIKGGRSGRMLTNILSRMSRGANEFREAFGQAIPIDQPLELLDILERFNKQWKQGTLSVAQLGAAFERLGLRGSPLFVTLVQHFDEIIEAQKELRDVTKESEEIELARLNNVGDQWKRFAGQFRALMIRVFGPGLETFKDAFKFYAEYLERANKAFLDVDKANAILEPFEALIGKTPATIASKVKLAGKLAQTDIEFLKELRKQLELQIEKMPKHLGAVGRQEYVEQIGLLNKIKDLMFYIDIAASMRTITTKKTVGEQKAVESEVEKEYNWRYKIRDEMEKIGVLSAMIDDRQSHINALEKDAKVTKVYEDRRKKFEEINKEAQKRDRMQQTLDRMLSDIQKRENAVAKARITNLRVDQQAIGYEDKRLISEAKRLQLKGVTADEEQKLLDISKKQYDLEIERLTLELQISRARGEGIVEAGLKAFEGKIAAEEAKRLRDRQIREARIRTWVQEQTAELRKQIALRQKALVVANIEHKSRGEIIKIEREILDLRLKDLYLRRNATEDLAEQRRIDNQIIAIQTEMVENQEKFKRATNAAYDATQRIKETVIDVKQAISDTIFAGYEVGRGGLADIFQNATGGFQEQRQEVVNLEGELARLNQEYQQALSEGNVDRAKQITDEMSRLREQIDDLKNPLNNLKDAARDWVKSMVDAIRKVINEWLAMLIIQKISTGALGLFGGGGSVGNPYGFTYQGKAMTVGGTGGVFPNIKSFRSFSRGGLTGSPTLALLGDNRSKQELVIPTENIEQNKVEGYMRESGQEPLNIINVLTEDDLVNVLAKNKGQRLIINTIGKDLARKGTTYRQIRR